MESFAAIADMIGNVAAVVAAVGVLVVNAKLDVLTGRADGRGDTPQTHANPPGLHRAV